jgi:DNA-binding transcriptional LysR family regulator
MKNKPKKNNLNLLQALDALLTEKNVTRAAKKLCITQSAMSNSLLQLRRFFCDDLLVRGVGGFVLTPKAKFIQPKLHSSIKKLQNIYEMDLKFIPKESNRTFNIGMSEIAQFLLLPNILSRIQKEAPDVKLEIKTINQVVSYEPFQNSDTFNNGNLELAFGCLSDTGNIHQLVKDPCFKLDRCVVARKGHPLLQKKISLKQYLSAKHIHLTYQPMMKPGHFDQALKKIGKKRNITISLTHLYPILFMLQRTDLIASLPDDLPKRLAKKLNLITQPIPFDMPERYIYTVWPRESKDDHGLTWIKAIFEESVATLMEERGH